MRQIRLLIFFPILFSCCGLSHKVHTRKYIEYRVFDSLEIFLNEQIKANQKGNNHFVGFELYETCPDKNMLPYSLQLYKIELVYDNDPVKDIIRILKKSNRVIAIGNNWYPVYIEGIDGIFSPYNDSIRNFGLGGGKYGIPDQPDWPFRVSFFVDMGKKTFYYPDAIEENERGKKKSR